MNKRIFAFFSFISVALLGCSANSSSSSSLIMDDVSFPESSYEGKDLLSDETKALVKASIKDNFKSLSSLEAKETSFGDARAGFYTIHDWIDNWSLTNNTYSLAVHSNHFMAYSKASKKETHTGDIIVFESSSSFIETSPLRDSSDSASEYGLFKKTTTSKGGYANKGIVIDLAKPAFCSSDTLDEAWNDYVANTIFPEFINDDCLFYQVGEEIHAVSSFSDVKYIPSSSGYPYDANRLSSESVNRSVGIIKKDASLGYRLMSWNIEESKTYTANVYLQPINELGNKQVISCSLEYEERNETAPSFTYAEAKKAYDNTPVLIRYDCSSESGKRYGPFSVASFSNESSNYQIIHGDGYSFAGWCGTLLDRSIYNYDVFAMSDRGSYDDGRAFKYPSSTLSFPSSTLFSTVVNDDGTFYFKKTNDHFSFLEVGLYFKILLDGEYANPAISITLN